MDKYLKREMPQCSLREGGGKELCKTVRGKMQKKLHHNALLLCSRSLSQNDTEAAKRTGEIFDTTPEKMSDVSGETRF